MKHLCIINPMAGGLKGNAEKLIDEIKDFFARNPRMENVIHITRWKRDATGFAMRYVKNASEMVRVYAFGGGGTLFEVINGVAGLPNAQIAYYPLGIDDDLLVAFGKNSKEIFKSLRNLSLSPVIPVDTILAGNHHAVSNINIGIGASSFRAGIKLSDRFMLPLHLSYNLTAFYYSLVKTDVQRYLIELENIELDEELTGIYVANSCGNGGGTPAPEARFNNGFIDLYLIKPAPGGIILKVLIDYQNGQYAKWPEYIRHYRCKKLRITSPKIITMILDGEVFYDMDLNLEIQPASVNFVCPSSIDKKFLEPPPAESVLVKDFTIRDFLPDGDNP